MPELPQLRALAERLHGRVGGAPFAGAEVLQFASLRTVRPTPDELVGRPLAAATHRGKYLVLDLGGPRIVVHLSQAGRVTVEDPARRSRPKRGVVRLLFEAAPALLVLEYGSERKARWWVLAAGGDGPLADLGPEPGTAAFARLVRSSDDRRRLHTMLRDQRTVAGLGRGYTDDILHRARLSPFASLSSVDAAARERLLAAVDEVLERGLRFERSREDGLPPKLGDHWLVHARHGTPCPRCGEQLRRVSYESYEVTYCPQCQTGGRVLADRRLSRLLK
ncbi:MAG TPA: DNA-formamidopyrimidine glycosylase family protein [Nitriliruptorales bacterium]|nr:DNA-formamidopyrimidine glycosylase family protein [Nitriliruptorales bacterium]